MISVSWTPSGSSEAIEKMLEFNAEIDSNNHLFVVLHHYMHMVMEMFAFSRSVRLRSGNRWKLFMNTYLRMAVQLCKYDCTLSH